MRALRWLVLGAMIGGGAARTAAAQAPRLALKETLRLDANKEDFPSVNSAFTGPGGLITVAIFADQQFRFYDSTGKRITTVGRNGAGPGEFERPLRYGWLADTLWVYDSSHMRFTLISRGGTVIRTILLPATLNAGMTSSSKDTPKGVFTYVPNAYFADGSSIGPAMLMTGRTKEGAVETEQFVVRATATGDVGRLAAQPPSAASSVSAQRNGSSWGMAVPFAFQPQTVFAIDGARFGFLTTEITSRDGGTYTVKVFSPKGDTVFARSYPFKGVPIPSRVVDSAITANSARVKTWPPDIVAQMEKSARDLAPPVYSPVGSLLFGRDNTVWVTQRRTTEGVVALVLNAKGDQVASVLLPPRSRLLEASLTRILVAETDDDGLTSVVGYRVSR